MLDRLAVIAQLYPRRILAGAVALVIAGGAAAGSVFDVLNPFGFDDPDSQSIQAREGLERAGEVEPGPEITALVRIGAPVSSPQGREAVERVARTLRKEQAVARVQTPFDPGGEVQVSKDGRSAYLLGFFRGGLEDKEKQETAKRLEEPVREAGAKLGGFALANEQVNKQVESDLQRAEAFAFPILFLISLLVFRSLVAAALPIMIGGLAILGALLGLRLGAEVADLSIFAVNLISGLGLGLAIDYSLFVVSRYREELARRGPGFEALQATMRTAGRTVIFSGLTVAAALASLMIFPQRFLYSMGVGGAMVALFAALISVTVLPSLLAVLGERVNALSPKRLQRAAERDARSDESGFWYRLSQFVMRRPIGVATLSALVLLAAGTPFLGAEFTSTDEQVLPTSASARQVGTELKEKFDSEHTSPVILEVRTRQAEPARVDRDLAPYAKQLSEIKGVTTVSPPVTVGENKRRLDVIIEPGYYSDRGGDLVREIRDLPAPFPVRAGGVAAEFVDQKESLEHHIPIAAAILITTTLVLLFMMTGSVVLPVKTLIMNVLTVSVAFGVLVFVFQDGRLEDLLAYESRGALDHANPLLLFATAFGLSTDYGIFLLTRIKEARDAGAGETESVAIGLERTGRIVTAAAILLTIAIGALAISKIVFIKEYGIGVAVAVLVDATIVRAFLVPSLMRLLGKWNWWAPWPLRRLHERFGISEAHPTSA